MVDGPPIYSLRPPEVGWMDAMRRYINRIHARGPMPGARAGYAQWLCKMTIPGDTQSPIRVHDHSVRFTERVRILQPRRHMLASLSWFLSSVGIRIGLAHCGFEEN
jgi:hypothetical protein